MVRRIVSGRRGEERDHVPDRASASGSRPVVGSSRKISRGAVHEAERDVEPAAHAARVVLDDPVGGVGRGRRP